MSSKYSQDLYTTVKGGGEFWDTLSFISPYTLVSDKLPIAKAIAIFIYRFPK
jgi:hypothetical protein